jgi:hypothetical protein
MGLSNSNKQDCQAIIHSHPLTVTGFPEVAGEYDIYLILIDLLSL